MSAAHDGDGERDGLSWFCCVNERFLACDVLCRCRLEFYESEEEDTVSVNHGES
jgi:hypothetical protein